MTLRILKQRPSPPAPRIYAAFIVQPGFARRYFTARRLTTLLSKSGVTNLTNTSLFNRPVNKPAPRALEKQLSLEKCLRKLGQAMFVGVGVIGFVMLFQVK
jgi:hypothetical protein